MTAMVYECSREGDRVMVLAAFEGNSPLLAALARRGRHRFVVDEGE